jgi:hypothetical protein
LGFMSQLKHAWNAFRYQDDNPGTLVPSQLGRSSSYRSDRPRLLYVNTKTIIASLYTRIAVDAASVPIRHVRLDANRQYQSDIDSGLNECLTVQANVDQAARMFRQDIVSSLIDYGVVGILPVDTTLNPLQTGGYDVNSMRVGRIVQWYPQHVTVRAYNEAKGIEEDVTVPKSLVAIVENPFYTIMNEPSSTLQRLLRKLHLLDAVDEQSASGKLDLIIQLPYVIKTETRRQQADTRLKEIEFQLKGSQYGIAYTDGTEKIIQLNRPADNNLMTQIEYLTKLLYGELGLTEEIMNNTASEDVMVGYYNRTIEPILAAITEAMARTFLTKTARSQGQAILYIRDPFKLVSVKDLAEIADKFTRNEVLSSNDMRSIIGFRPSSDPKADKLLNKNIPVAYAELPKDGVALGRPKLPPKSPIPQIPASPQIPAITRGVTSQNGSS